MLLAVQGYNSATIRFKTETFIVLSVIAWTYLLLAFYTRKGIDCIYREKNGAPKLTPNGRPKYLELEALLKKQECPITDPSVKANLLCLIGLRHEIEHRGTHLINHAVASKVHACALNFNTAIKALFGPKCGLDHELGFAIQFASLDPVQPRLMRGRQGLPKVIETYNQAFEATLPQEILNDPSYAYRVAIVPRTANRPGQADEVFEVVDPNSAESRNAEGRNIALIFKDREKPKFRAKDVVEHMKRAGYKRFNMHHHTRLWKDVGAKDPKKGYGVEVAGTWYWYQTWIDFVRRYCDEHASRYR